MEGYQVVGTDHRGCGGECLETSESNDLETSESNDRLMSKSNNIGLILGIVGGSFVVVGLIVWVSLRTVHTKHIDILKQLNTKLISTNKLKF